MTKIKVSFGHNRCEKNKLNKLNNQIEKVLYTKRAKKNQL